jgi:predicted O-methyltransferase YrrM
MTRISVMIEKIKKLKSETGRQLVILETGCIRNISEQYIEGDGHSTRHIAEFITNDIFYSVDLSTKICRQYLADLGLLSKVRLVESDSLEFLKRFRNIIDIAYLDSDNNSELIFKEYMLVLPKMNKGGFIIIDDAIPDSENVVKCHKVLPDIIEKGFNHEIINNQLFIYL